MKISCDEAAHICTRSQYKEASLWEILKLRLHILYCRACAKFSKQNKTLTSLCDRADMQVLSENDKKSMKKDLEKHL
ncbi:hypothetical protein GTQ34_13255 [Muricauda sp. JGD-17]|uniref:Glycine dehydrogenase n=1 Tax=Flagellimonas ochracea TaxID=2696472 RepID=A0A964TDG8_9FLAO|nr:hypothetical protein [Allomuricauda ochracea]NAY92884.1 hypothetical protein [Allomuricauda ochracea]